MRLSRLFAPLTKAKSTAAADLLLNHGYVRHAGSGVYNMLPLGLAVQNNIENIVRRHLNSIECAELSLTSLSSVNLWKTSGRLADKREFFFTNDNKYILAPTCEEEITMLAAETASYRQLPLRLYQITRKYRNEKRPRGGLLRAKEFVMKDLYSFDETYEAALASYRTVQAAYEKIFTDLGVSFIVAEADSGSIGGSLSHEYHILSPNGEDTVVQCGNCGYTANVERAQSTGGSSSSDVSSEYFYASSDEDLIVETRYPANRVINPLVLKQLYPRLVPAAVGNAEDIISTGIRHEIVEDVRCATGSSSENRLVSSIVEVESNDSCIKCGHGALRLQHAIEVGHTFYLGTKYSLPFKATVLNRDNQRSPVEMGCYGIGISRLIAAIAETTKDSHGLKWPKSVTPMDAVVISNNEVGGMHACQKLAENGIRAVWDDRSSQFGMVLGNARAIGFPLTVILGKNFEHDGKVEIQPRHKDGEKIFTSMGEMSRVAKQILDDLM
jgi:prolyl-tRNA synthetase